RVPETPPHSHISKESEIRTDGGSLHNKLHLALQRPGPYFSDFTLTSDGAPVLCLYCPRFGSLIITSQRLLDALYEATGLQADATYDVVRSSRDLDRRSNRFL